MAPTALSAASAPALAKLELATKNACMACHAVDKKVLGPSYQDVAKQYASQKDAVAQISERIRRGRLGQVGRHADAGAACAG